MTIFSAPQKVYFFQRPSDGLIKIGFSHNIPQRILNIQRDVKEKIKVLGHIEGGRTREHSLHKQYAKHRIIGEWFAPCEKLLDFIKCNASTAIVEWNYVPIMTTVTPKLYRLIKCSAKASGRSISAEIRYALKSVYEASGKGRAMDSEYEEITHYVPCPECHGSGRVDYSISDSHPRRYDECDRCRGQGRVETQ